MRTSRAFTLIEMLVVISLITLLLSIASPALRASRESARGVKCLSQLHQLGMATDTFTVDHQERLPGIWGSVWVNLSIPDGGCWLSNPVSPATSWSAAPQTGVLWRYAGRAPELYRCPSLQTGALGSGVGSNGRFDYSAFHAFAGARITKMPKSSNIALGGYNSLEVRTPWLIEEAPERHINTLHVEGGFGGSDLIGNWHNGGGNLVSYDGSAVALRNTYDLSSYVFTATAPSGASVNLGSHSTGWGGWERR